MKKLTILSLLTSLFCLLVGQEYRSDLFSIKGIKSEIRQEYDFQEIDQAPIKPCYEIKKYMKFYGMSSDTAMNKHSGGVADYRSSEGRTVEVPYRGSVKGTVKDILGGLRSTCTYVGAPTLKQLSKCTTFVRCTQQFNRVFAQ